MFAGDQQHMPKTFTRQIPAFRDHLIEAERDAQDGIVPREATVTAVIDAFVGKIKRGEKAHGAPEILQGQRTRLLRQSFKLLIGLGRDQILEAAK